MLENTFYSEEDIEDTANDFDQWLLNGQSEQPIKFREKKNKAEE